MTLFCPERCHPIQPSRIDRWRQLELLQDLEKSGGAIDVRGKANFADYDQLEKSSEVRRI